MGSINKQKIWVCKKFITSLKKIAPNLVKKTFFKNNEVIIKTSRNKITNLLFFLKNHTLFQYKTLFDIIAYDIPSKKYRFLLVYCLLSKQFNSRIFIAVCCNSHTKVNTVSNLFSSANWFEREIWDMFGIFFIQHPDLRRILTDYGFTSHPLRKDFPLTGYKEVFYSDKEKRVIYSSIENMQAYRVFYFKNPWIKN